MFTEVVIVGAELLTFDHSLTGRKCAKMQSSRLTERFWRKYLVYSSPDR